MIDNLMRATMQDVARESGCSITSVSLVLNNRKNSISEERKRKILETADRLGYCVNRRAASLVTKRTGLVGLIIPDNCNVFFGNISKGLETRLRNSGYSVIYGNSNNDAANDRHYFRVFSEQCVDGLILVKSAATGEQDDATLGALINGADFPVILLDRVMNGVRCEQLSVDNQYGGYLATKYLLELGHRRIACYTGSLNVSSARDRLEGYKKALSEFGIPINRDLIFEGDYQLGKEHEALEQFAKNGATAIFAQNDLMACGLYREILQSGRKIPEDYSVVGFDNMEMGGVVTPRLTTVQQPIEEMAQLAADRLLTLIEAGSTKECEHIRLAPSLIIRESAAPFRSV